MSDGEWTDCFKWWPIYRDYTGKWRVSNYTEKRTVERNGKRVTEYRPRAETDEEWQDRQW